MRIYHLYVGLFGTPGRLHPALDACRLGARPVLPDAALARGRPGQGAAHLGWALIALSLAATAYPVMATNCISLPANLPSRDRLQSWLGSSTG